MCSQGFGVSLVLSGLFWTFSNRRPCGAGVGAPSAAATRAIGGAAVASAVAAAWMNARRPTYRRRGVISELRNVMGRTRAFYAIGEFLLGRRCFLREIPRGRH